MKVTIGGKTTSVFGQPEIEAIKEILIFGVDNVQQKELTAKNAVMVYGTNGPKLKKRKRKLVNKIRIIWSDDELAKLKEYAGDGMPIVKMAIMLDKKSYNVSNKLRSLNLLKTRKDVEKVRKNNAKAVKQEEKKSNEEEASSGLDDLRDDFRKRMEGEGFRY